LSLMLRPSERRPSAAVIQPVILPTILLPSCAWPQPGIANAHVAYHGRQNSSRTAAESRQNSSCQNAVRTLGCPVRRYAERPDSRHGGRRRSGIAAERDGASSPRREQSATEIAHGTDPADGAGLKGWLHAFEIGQTRPMRTRLSDTKVCHERWRRETPLA